MLTHTERLFDAGRIAIEEQPELDLAVVRGPGGGEWDPMAVHTRTATTRLLLVHHGRALATTTRQTAGGVDTAFMRLTYHASRPSGTEVACAREP